MSDAEAHLLKKLLFAVLTPVPARCIEKDWRLVEVSRYLGVDPKTAETLVNKGLAVYEMPTWDSEYTNRHVRLKRLEELQS